MLSRIPKRLTALLIAVLIAAIVLITLYSHQARIKHRQLADGSRVVLAQPAGKSSARVLLALPANVPITDDALLQLAQQQAAELVAFTLPADNCASQQQRAQAAARLLSAHPTLVAGISQGGAFAWRWLAMQNNDDAQALSVGFSLKQPDCELPLPDTASHGHWFAAWNNNPDDLSAAFARNQPNAQVSISGYDTTLADLLEQRLSEVLGDQPEAMPTIETGLTPHSDTLTLFYSGDGGWRDLDKAVAEAMSARGFAVVGIDSLRYFWEHKSPEQAASDLSQLMQYYREHQGVRHFVLAGFSFGADVLPAVYNRLPAADQDQVDAVLLMALARSGSFQIEVKGWLGQTGEEARTGPEMAKLPPAKVLCIYGQEEQSGSGCTEPTAVGERLQLPGGHHFDEDYPALAGRLLQAIALRSKR